MGKRKEKREQRFERWLAWVAMGLEAKDIEPRLLYEDRPQGNLMVLSAATKGLVELQVHRHGRGGVLILVAESAQAATDFAEAVVGRHDKVPRRLNAKRKFIHRIERLAEHLPKTFDARKSEFPMPALKQLQTWLPSARPMIGAEATFRDKHEDEASSFDPTKWFESADKKLAREAKRYPSRFAAMVQAGGKPRAALYTGAAFSLGAIALSAEALAAPPAEQQREVVGEDVIDLLDGAELAYELGAGVGDVGLELGAELPSAGDCGGIDFPDLGACADIDCGGCDF